MTAACYNEDVLVFARGASNPRPRSKGRGFLFVRARDSHAHRNVHSGQQLTIKYPSPWLNAP